MIQPYNGTGDVKIYEQATIKDKYPIDHVNWPKTSCSDIFNAEESRRTQSESADSAINV